MIFGKPFVGLPLLSADAQYRMPAAKAAAKYEKCFAPEKAMAFTCRCQILDSKWGFAPRKYLGDLYTLKHFKLAFFVATENNINGAE